LSFRRLLRPSLVALLAALVLAAASPGEGARRHVRLVKSTPVKDSVVTAAPATVELWFSEPVELGVTRVRLTGVSGTTVATGPLKRADVADAPIIAAVLGPMADGIYTVNWSTASKDGHPVRGTFEFTVRAASGR
jgi:methionine-rich copper-binding protein CopC